MSTANGTSTVMIELPEEVLSLFAGKPEALFWCLLLPHAPNGATTNQPRATPSLLPTSYPPPMSAPGPNVSQAQARSYIRWRPIHTVCGPGSLLGRLM